MKAVIAIALLILFFSSVSASADDRENVIKLADKLENCEPYQDQFKHPFTGEMMERRIVGKEGETCHYVEQMPNKGRMECKYTGSMRKAVAQYYRDLAASKSARTQVSLSGDKTTVTYEIDGKEVANPLQEAMATGQCKVLGY